MAPQSFSEQPNMPDYITEGNSEWSYEQTSTNRGALFPSNGYPEICDSSCSQEDSDTVSGVLVGTPSSVPIANDQRNRYAFPNEAEQRALMTLRDRSDSTLSRWFKLARQSPTGKNPSVQETLCFLPEPALSHSHGSTTASYLPLQLSEPVSTSDPLGKPDLGPNGDLLMQDYYDGSPWRVSPGPMFQSQRAHHPFILTSHFQPSVDTSSSLDASELHSGYTNVTGFTSTPQNNSPFPSTPLCIPPRPTGSSERSDKLKRRQSASSGSSTLSCSPALRGTIKKSSRKMYSCTFCDSQSTFKSKHEWKRHERSHVPQVEYRCLPRGAVISINDCSLCAICGISKPRGDHMVEHKMHLCLYKAVSDRTYYRKDKFAKHLRVHGLSLESPQVVRWSRPLPERVLGCGFCIKYFDTFDQRSQHVAWHFEQGWRKESWSRSTVLRSLLTQSFVDSAWQSLLGVFCDAAMSSIAWSESSSTDWLQHRLEAGGGNGQDLAVAAYNLSSLCSGKAPQVGVNKDQEASDGPA